MILNLKTLVAASLAVLATSSYAQTMCVFDPLGTSGDNYSMMKDYALAAKNWGAEIQLKPYTDEQQAAKDFAEGRVCDAAAISGIRMRQFNNFVGTIDAVGGLVTDDTSRLVYTLMASPKLAPDMLDHDVEVVGITTLGLAYVMVNDRKINQLWNSVGKRWGVLDYDVAQQLIVNKFGAKPVLLELDEIGTEFNAGQVDIIALPLLAFKPLELSRGIGKNGAIINYPATQVTFDVLTHPHKFPAGYGQKSRNWVLSQLDRQYATVHRAESSIDPRYWENVPANVAPSYSKVMRNVRIFLASDNVYNKRMLHILKNVRCHENPNNFDCNLIGE